DVANKKQINADTVFGLASLTKSFTCAAIMKLVEAGKIALTDSVDGYLPELRIKKTEKLSEMTIAHVMTHASGLPPLPSLDLAMVRKPNQELDTDYGDIPLKKDQLQTYEELLTFIGTKNIDLVSDPGESFSYSNDAYALFGASFELVTGISSGL